MHYTFGPVQCNQVHYAFQVSRAHRLWNDIQNATRRFKLLNYVSVN